MFERRASPRLRPPRTIVPWLSGGDQLSQGALLVDFSRSGIGLLLSRPVPPEWLVLIEVPQFPNRFLARIVYHLQQPDDTWRVGIKLLYELSPSDMAELISE
jgi:hypothetical protein